MLFIASWIDKSLGLLIGGFMPTPYETYEVYTPYLLGSVHRPRHLRRGRPRGHPALEDRH